MFKKQLTLVYYYIPQDHDDPQIPNVFEMMMGKNNIKLQSSYIFRFKVMYDNAIAWLDLPDLDTKLPAFKDKIIMKVSRISWQTNKDHPYGHYRMAKKDYTSISSAFSLPKIQQKGQSKQGQIAQPILMNKVQSSNLLDGKHDKIGLFEHDLDLLHGQPSSANRKANKDIIGMDELI